MKAFDAITKILVAVGALNWGLVALAEFDLVATVAGLEFGQTNAFSRIIYGLVGISAIAQIVRFAGARDESPSRSLRTAA